MIPTLAKTELHRLISDADNTEISSLSLKNKIKTLRRKILHGQLSEETAVELLYNDCLTYYELYRSDLYRIFPEKHYD